MFVFSFIISLFLLQAPVSSIATNSPVEETVKSKMKTEQSYDLLASRYEDVLSAYDRLEKELTRNLTIISIIVALFGVLVPLLLVFYSSRDIDKTIKAHARRNEEFTKKVETFAMQTAHYLEEYKKQNQIRELMNNFKGAEYSWECKIDKRGRGDYQKVGRRIVKLVRKTICEKLQPPTIRNLSSLWKEPKLSLYL